MKNHLYQFGNVVRLQDNTGPTGLDITGLATDVYMIWWDEKFLNRLKELRIHLDIYKRFKDDLNILGNSLPLGARYCAKNKEILYTNPSYPSHCQDEMEEQIIHQGNLEVNTFYILNQIANDVDSMISFTYDIPSNHETKKMPVLDVQVYLDSQYRIMHEFYEKPTRNPLVLLASSAHSWQVKRTVLTQEALRRMRNTSPLLDPAITNHHLSMFMVKLKDSGYSHKFRAEIVRSARNAYQLQLERHKNGTRPLYRDKQRIIKDQQERGAGRIDWWNKNRGDDKFDTVLFVPPTPGGKLAKLIQAKERSLWSKGNIKIKVVEGPGVKLKDVLVNKNPYPTIPCHRVECPLCKKTAYTNPNTEALLGGRLPCTIPNVGYQVVCLDCQENGLTVRYEGETGRPMVSRAMEHLRKLKSEDPSHPLVKHKQTDHPTEKKK